MTVGEAPQQRMLLPGSTTDLGQSQGDTPDLAFVSQAIFADELQLGITRTNVSRAVNDLSRDKLMLSGRIRTVEPTRKL